MAFCINYIFFNPRSCGVGNLPTAQETICYFSRNDSNVLKLPDFFKNITKCCSTCLQFRQHLCSSLGLWLWIFHIEFETTVILHFHPSFLQTFFVKTRMTVFVLGFRLYGYLILGLRLYSPVCNYVRKQLVGWTKLLFQKGLYLIAGLGLVLMPLP